MALQPPTPYKLFVVGGNAFVWDAAVAIALRSHRIVGSLVGSLPRAPQQNVFLGLPLLLLEEEVNVLVEEGLAVLVDDSAACSHRLSSEDLLAFEREVRAHLRKVEAEAEDRRRDLEKAGRERNAVSCEAGAPEGGGGGGGGMSKKKMKRLARQLEKLHPRPALAEAVGLCPAAEEADLPACASEPDASSNGRDAGDRAPGGGAPPPPTAPAAKSLRAPLRRRAGEFCPWRAAAESAVSCGTLAAARRLGLWTFPRTERDRARLDVFRDLRKRGYYLTDGMKFGADFLVYDGDPFVFHSLFAATVKVDSRSSPGASVIHANDLAALCRLGTAARKSRLFCSWRPLPRNPAGRGQDEEGPEVSSGVVQYITMKWADISSVKGSYEGVRFLRAAATCSPSDPADPIFATPRQM